MINCFALTEGNLDKRADHLEQVWRQMTKTNIVEERYLRSVITDSWKRCLQNGVDFEKKHAPFILSERQFSNDLLIGEKFIEISTSALQNFSQWIRGSGFLMTLCNSKGIILQIQGDEHVLNRARMNNFVEGADWSETAAGTNAIGTCIEASKPVQVFSAEHFCIGWQDWTCSGAPIKDPFSGKVLGVLDLSGHVRNAHPHNLSLVIAAAQMIEQKLKEWQITMQQKTYDILIESASDGIMIIDEDQAITSMNPSALQMLGERLHASGVALSIYPEIYEKWKGISSGRQMIEEELQINRRFLRITFLPLTYGKICSGYLILLRENQKSMHKSIPNFKKIESKENRTFFFSSIISSSRNMETAIETARIAALHDTHVLLLGESGTGKEMFAHAIHNESFYKDGPFIPVNCGAISKDLIESELFGYLEGAFTGAMKNGRKGKFEQASGGTLFLDEIGEMPLDMQVSLLRVLEEKMVYPVGGGKGLPVNCKIIAATHKDLYKEVENGRFRQDLYYRLNVITIEIPALRERTEDIPLLVDNFLKRLHRGLDEVDPGVMAFFQQYSWPGNIRQLKNTIERLVYLSQGSNMNANLLPSDLLRLYEPSKKGLMSLNQHEGEKYRLKKALYETGYNHTEAAQHLGISRSTLYRKLKKYNLV